MLLGRGAEQGGVREAAGRRAPWRRRGAPDPRRGRHRQDRAPRGVRRAADGFLVLEARPVESEARLAFAGLGDLLRPLLGRLGAVPAPQAATLRAALALGPPVEADRFAAYTATLSLLRAVASREPVLVLIDDGHWLDSASSEAITFAARRLGDEPVAVLIAVRTGEPDPFRGSRLAELVLEGLPEPASRELLARSAPRPLPEPLAARLLEAAAGNPLALIERRAGRRRASGAGRPRSTPRSAPAGP